MDENGLPVAALLYDFDKTLSPKDMQEYAFIPGIGMTPGEFWQKCEDRAKRHNMDQILSYMLVMKEEAEGKMPLTREVFKSLGQSVELFPGVVSWFKRVNAYGGRLGLNIEHYILSSGLKEIIEGTRIAGEFKRIYAAEFCYNDSGVPVWPAMAVNYTSKTQFLFRVNKGILDVTEHKALNEYVPEDERRVPFRNIIYIGDGMTDVPCMRLTKSGGGHSLAVYDKDPAEARKLLRQGRIDFSVPADYSKGGLLERTVFSVLEQIAVTQRNARYHMENMESARADGCE